MILFLILFLIFGSYCAKNRGHRQFRCVNDRLWPHTTYLKILKVYGNQRWLIWALKTLKLCIFGIYRADQAKMRMAWCVNDRLWPHTTYLKILKVYGNQRWLIWALKTLKICIFETYRAKQAKMKMAWCVNDRIWPHTTNLKILIIYGNQRWLIWALKTLKICIFDTYRAKQAKMKMAWCVNDRIWPHTTYLKILLIYGNQRWLIRALKTLKIWIFESYRADQAKMRMAWCVNDKIWQHTTYLKILIVYGNQRWLIRALRTL